MQLLAAGVEGVLMITSIALDAAAKSDAIKSSAAKNALKGMSTLTKGAGSVLAVVTGGVGKAVAEKIVETAGEHMANNKNNQRLQAKVANPSPPPSLGKH